MGDLRPGHLVFRRPGRRRRSLRCDVVVGADGSYGASRPAIPQDKRKDYLRIYPFGWFGILCEALPSEESVYARHAERGFALISSRTPEVSAMASSSATG